MSWEMCLVWAGVVAIVDNFEAGLDGHGSESESCIKVTAKGVGGIRKYGLPVSCRNEAGKWHAWAGRDRAQPGPTV